MKSLNKYGSYIMVFAVIFALIFVCPFCISEIPADDEAGIIELWESVRAPAPIELNSVKLKPKETAFLILDIEELTCNSQRRPRCIASVPKIKKFLGRVRDKRVTVVYSLTRNAEQKTILPGVKPLGNEPIVKSSVDKFFNTDLENILRERGIKTVVVAGTTAEGAVLHTATGAAMRGLKVIVPIDGMSAGTLYAEQYTVWHLVNAPGSRRMTTLTRFDMIEF